MKITSVFANGQEIPVKYTCDGDNISPPLTIDDAPQGTQSLLLIFRDNESDENFRVHWLVFNIPPTNKWIAEAKLPEGAVEGVCSNNTLGYEGPCPKYYQGVSHYKFELYALDIVLDVPHTANFESIQVAMKGHVLDSAQLIGSVDYLK